MSKNYVGWLSDDGRSWFSASIAKTEDECKKSLRTAARAHFKFIREILDNEENVTLHWRITVGARQSVVQEGKTTSEAAARATD